ncbi:chemotaxis protein CheA [Virgibacillus alimentarius]|uniref:Chemotaxis protein CheA n=1 Tax=Virgibacillus alimentarius TaxID=698769 RepID=A0ABS4S8M3_9BACI|nr:MULTISPECIES: chemotaxis protein CheA [Virgibacillus]MBP2257847.1 two-component system chemotaxis sensor kinase CheA [Virgibacillus alimentarius]HLR66571.1 chemotaxis protein CheA [Virgibacillus sp.]
METSQYLEMFLDEGREHLQAVNDNLLKLEKYPHDFNLVEAIFRSAHTLKGMAATMGFEDIAALTHQMENILDKIRNNKLPISTEVIDITFLAIEYLEEMVNSIGEGSDGKKDVTSIIEHLANVGNGGNPSQTDQVLEKEDEPIIELDNYQITVVTQAVEQGYHAFLITIRLIEECLLKGVRAYMVFEILDNQGEIIKTIPVVDELEEGNFERDFTFAFLSQKTADEIKDLIWNVSEIENVDISNLSRVTKANENKNSNNESDAEKTHNNFNGKKSISPSSKTIRVSLARIDHLMNLFEEMVIDRSRLTELAKKIENQALTETVEHTTRISGEMQDLILTMRMVQVEQVFNRFPRMVRGLAKDLGKEIELKIIGADTELDRTVIDELGDPLVHLIRNSVDHGIEAPSKRIELGKPAKGKLILRAFHSGNHVFIEIEDDGAGINRDKVEAKAIEQDLITSEQARNLTDDKIHQLILASGFSTNDKVSDISGRGVGLDVVKNTIESLGGEISIKSQQGKGSEFSIQLPLTLSILAALLIKVQGETYAIPLSSIVETVLLEKEQIMYAHGQIVMDFRGKIIPLISLKEFFAVPSKNEGKKQQHAVVLVSKGENITGLIVDSFLGQREVVLKSLGNYLKDVYAISGATILGDGRVSLIIDPNALIK